MQIHTQKIRTACLQESLTLNKNSVPGNSLVIAWVLVQNLTSQDCFFSVKSKYTETVGFFNIRKVLSGLTIY